MRERTEEDRTVHIASLEDQLRQADEYRDQAIDEVIVQTRENVQAANDFALKSQRAKTSAVWSARVAGTHWAFVRDFAESEQDVIKGDREVLSALLADVDEKARAEHHCEFSFPPMPVGRAAFGALDEGALAEAVLEPLAERLADALGELAGAVTLALETGDVAEFDAEVGSDTGGTDSDDSVDTEREKEIGLGFGQRGVSASASPYLLAYHVPGLPIHPHDAAENLYFASVVGHVGLTYPGRGLCPDPDPGRGQDQLRHGTARPPPRALRGAAFESPRQCPPPRPAPGAAPADARLPAPPQPLSPFPEPSPAPVRHHSWELGPHP
ncbi:hypothetical protein B0H10DRAFT_2210760 [Mycena sp. CBHHK59/15]|nr:hypothetical protein B0H10DRAFT_2210760 [Mycena sp. CBHHK59/15]